MTKIATAPISQAQIQRLAANGKVLDLTERNLSYGAKTKTKNMIDEAAKALQMSIRISNASDVAKHLALAPLMAGTGMSVAFNASIYEDKAALIAELGVTSTLYDGTVEDDVTVQCLDSRQTVKKLVRYFSENPTRITRISMKSAVIDGGAKDSSNYDNTLKTAWFNPFDVNEYDHLSLRPLQEGGNNFNPDMLDLDLQRLNFPVVLSREHAFIFQVNAGTALTLTLFIGAQDSAAQRFWRNVRAADDVLRREVGIA